MSEGNKATLSYLHEPLLIPKIDTSLNYQLRNGKKIHVPKFYTERFKNSYIIASCLELHE